MIVYAQRGEHVTCENGHHICTFACDVFLGDRTKHIDWQLVDWQQDEPEIGHIIPLCAICGGRWSDGQRVHFPDGWRYRRDGKLCRAAIYDEIFP